MNKLKPAVTILLLLYLSTVLGCGVSDRYVVANVTGFARVCADGVLYLQFPSGVSVAYDQGGKVKTC